MQTRQLVADHADKQDTAMSPRARFEAEVLQLLNQLNAKKETIQARHKAELDEVTKDIEAVLTTARLLRQPITIVTMPDTWRAFSVPKDLCGKSARVACIEIAKANDGIVRISRAKDALIEAGILKPSKNAWGAVYTTLARSREFEKGPQAGTFRLVSDSEQKDSQASLIAN